MCSCESEVLQRSKKWREIWAIIAGKMAVVSVIIAACIHDDASYKSVGQGIVLFWVIAPPTYFFCDWGMFAERLEGDERERVMHIHNLGRNMWLAFVVLLAAVLDVEWPPVPGFGG